MKRLLIENINLIPSKELCPNKEVTPEYLDNEYGYIYRMKYNSTVDSNRTFKHSDTTDVNALWSRLHHFTVDLCLYLQEHVFPTKVHQIKEALITLDDGYPHVAINLYLSADRNDAVYITTFNHSSSIKIFHYHDYKAAAPWYSVMGYNQGFLNNTSKLATAVRYAVGFHECKKCLYASSEVEFCGKGMGMYTGECTNKVIDSHPKSKQGPYLMEHLYNHMRALPSKVDVLRIRQELDDLIVKRARPLFQVITGTTSPSSAKSSCKVPVDRAIDKGRDIKLPLTIDVTRALKLYATTLSTYLVANGIPSVVAYDSGPDRRTSGSIIVSDGGSAWYINHYVLDIPIGTTNAMVYIPGACIWLGMSTEQYVTNHYAMTTKYLGGIVSTTDLDNLVEYLQRTIDTIKGNLLCSGCHYSSRDENLRCCGRGLIPAPQCSGYRKRM